MLLRWILRLLGLGFLLGAGAVGLDREEAEERQREYRRKAARRLHRIANKIAEAGEDTDSPSGV